MATVIQDKMSAPGDRNFGNRDGAQNNFRSDSSGFGDARGARFGIDDRFGGEHFGGGGFRGRR